MKAVTYQGIKDVKVRDVHQLESQCDRVNPHGDAGGFLSYSEAKRGYERFGVMNDGCIQVVLQP